MTVVGAKIDVIFGTWAQTVQHDVPAYILPKSSAFKKWGQLFAKHQCQS